MQAETCISVTAISLFIRLFIAHMAGDFILQQKSWVKQRATYKWKSGLLYANAAIIAVLSWILSGYPHTWLIPILIFAVHAGIDIIKSYAPDKPVIFAADQLLHLAATAGATWLYLTREGLLAGPEWLFGNLELWIYIAAYTMVTWPMGIIIGMLTRKWSYENETSDGLKDAGRYIGILERLLILTFVLINQFPAVGFLVAAKSVLRFGDIRDSNNRKGAEYILIGTMISFAVAIFTGLLAQWLIKIYAV